MMSPSKDWIITGKPQFPKLVDPAIRALTVAIQSADVERVCKAHNVIHTKSRNLLANKTVQMLLFAYCNLRLLKMCPELGDFLVTWMMHSNADDEEPLEAGPAPVDSDDDDEEQEVLNLADSEDEGDGSS